MTVTDRSGVPAASPIDAAASIETRRPPAKEWRKLPTPPAGFAQTLGLPSFQAHLLYNRGVRSREYSLRFLNAGSGRSHDPMTLPDMGDAVSRLRRALDTGEPIGVFGDFDTDGLSGTALVVAALRELGGRPVPYIPHRVKEGHGLNKDAVSALRGKGVSVLITVDCGSTSVEEIEFAASIGIDTVVTDHHSLPPALPAATAVVNPHRSDSGYAYDGLTGAGLAFKLAEALFAEIGRPVPDHLYELAALGTVADVGPLTDENRYLVAQGLTFLNETRHPGLKALIARAGLSPGSIDTDSLSFGLIPRLNASGRIGDPSRTLELLITDDAAVAEAIADELEMQNEERRRLTADGVAGALEQVFEEGGPDALMLVSHPEWQPGILGLIASQLSELYHRPAVAVSIGAEVSRGSARSVPEFNIVDAIRRSRDLLLRFGGHPRAAGFSLPSKDLPRLTAELVAEAREKLDGVTMMPSVDIDCEISPVLLDSNFDFIQSMQPFGEANPTPVFLTRNARVRESRQVGAEGRHLKMTVSHGGRQWDAIAFRQGDKMPNSGDRVELVYKASCNDWGGQPRLQLEVLDFRVR